MSYLIKVFAVVVGVCAGMAAVIQYCLSGEVRARRRNRIIAEELPLDMTPEEFDIAVDKVMDAIDGQTMSEKEIRQYINETFFTN